MFDVNFTSAEKKDAFTARLKRIRQRLTPAGAPLIDNRELMSQLFDAVEEATQPSLSNFVAEPVIKSFLPNGGEKIHWEDCCTPILCGVHVGIYTGDSSPDQQQLFVCERRTFIDLCEGLARSCSCGMGRGPWTLESITQV